MISKETSLHSRGLCGPQSELLIKQRNIHHARLQTRPNKDIKTHGKCFSTLNIKTDRVSCFFIHFNPFF